MNASRRIATKRKQFKSRLASASTGRILFCVSKFIYFSKLSVYIKQPFKTLLLNIDTVVACAYINPKHFQILKISQHPFLFIFEMLKNLQLYIHIHINKNQIKRKCYFVCLFFCFICVFFFENTVCSSASGIKNKKKRWKKPLKKIHVWLLPLY